MSRRPGFALAIGSVALVSAAQLALRWSMNRLPAPSLWLDTLSGTGPDSLALLVLSCGVLAYGLSLLCWIGALGHLPLARAYSLLSASYALVYLGAALLPGFGEPLTFTRTLGVGLVIGGVLAINAPRNAKGEPAKQRQEDLV
ncbi:4-amino-4-deoxy-L-arabinose-phosphoundecaprenol flippase subunit ArnF [Pseudomonas sp. CR3202]|uniref:4-amino-4-deoxy-L-arabinose-phosphoundecaprenol flippase subunit ArnF n=1 Tax=Pseudomonas sp. CR3202 TaxID=3351532 RepID=UPI003BF3AA86